MTDPLPKYQIALQRQHDRHNTLAAFGAAWLLLGAILLLAFATRTPEPIARTRTVNIPQAVIVYQPTTVVVTATASVAPYYGIPSAYDITPLPYYSPTPTPSARFMSLGPVSGSVEVQ